MLTNFGYGTKVIFHFWGENKENRIVAESSNKTITTDLNNTKETKFKNDAVAKEQDQYNSVIIRDGDKTTFNNSIIAVNKQQGEVESGGEN